MPHKPVSIQYDIGNAKTIGSRALINMEFFVADTIVLVFTGKDHFVSLDPNVAFAAAPVFDVANTIAIAEDLDGIFSRIPTSAKIIVLRGKLFLKTGG